MKVNHKKEKILHILGYIAMIGLSLFVMLFVVSSTWIGYSVKTRCVSAVETPTEGTVSRRFPPNCWTKVWILARAIQPFGRWVRSAISAPFPCWKASIPVTFPPAKPGMARSANTNYVKPTS